MLMTRIPTTLRAPEPGDDGGGGGSGSTGTPPPAPPAPAAPADASALEKENAELKARLDKMDARMRKDADEKARADGKLEDLIKQRDADLEAAKKQAKEYADQIAARKKADKEAEAAAAKSKRESGLFAAVAKAKDVDVDMVEAMLLKLQRDGKIEALDPAEDGLDAARDAAIKLLVDAKPGMFGGGARATGGAPIGSRPLGSGEDALAENKAAVVATARARGFHVNPDHLV